MSWWRTSKTYFSCFAWHFVAATVWDVCAGTVGAPAGGVGNMALPGIVGGGFGVRLRKRHSDTQVCSRRRPDMSRLRASLLKLAPVELYLAFGPWTTEQLRALCIPCMETARKSSPAVMGSARRRH